MPGQVSPKVEGGKRGMHLFVGCGGGFHSLIQGLIQPRTRPVQLSECVKISNCREVLLGPAWMRHGSE